MFDVVTVPDFSGESARRFELMTLFFLASWIEYGGESNNLPLHIAAIGEAPESVRILAGRCGAEITTHLPMHFGGFANKLRGFEVNRCTDHILLIDSDVFLISDITNLPLSLGEHCISASIANGCPIRVDEWLQIFRALDIPVPKEGPPPLNDALDTFRANPNSCPPFLPYYNAGILFAPWTCELNNVWSRHIEKIMQIKIPFIGPKMNVSNQPAFATAVAELQNDGLNFQLLPDEYHVRWQHLTTTTVRLKNTKLLHAVGFCRQEVDPLKCTAIEAVDKYCQVMLRLTHKVHFHRVERLNRFRQILYFLRQSASRRDVRKLHARMKLLCAKYVNELIA